MKKLLWLIFLCASLRAATVAELLADGYPVKSGAITPTSQGIWISNGTAFQLLAKGSNGQVLTTTAGSLAWGSTAGLGTVTSVDQSFTGGLISVSGNPITSAGTLALTVAGTSGGIVYFNSATGWSSSGALAANALVVGGGAGTAPSTITTGTGVATALGVNVGSAGAFVLFNGAGGTPISLTGTNITGTASGLTAGAATNATNATNIAITDDTSTNGSMKFVFVSTTTGNLPAKVCSTKGLFLNPSTGILSLLNDTAAAKLNLADGSGGITTLTRGVTGGDSTFSLPTSNGTNKYLLQTNGSGVTSWVQADLTAAVTGALPVANGGTGITALGTGVATALGVNVGSAGAFVTFNGAGGTPSSLTLTNATGLTSAGIVDGTIVNADVNVSAAIAGTKVAPDFGNQNIVTTGSLGAAGTTITTLAMNGSITNTARMVTISGESNGAGAIGFAMQTTNLMADATSKLVSFQNQSTEKSYIDLNGKFVGGATLTAPVLGAATATSVNKVAITAPASSATLTIADGSSLITSGANSVTLTSTGSTNVTLPTTGTLAVQGNSGSFLLTAAGSWVPTTSGATAAAQVETSSNKVNYFRVAFADASTTYCEWGAPMPSDYNGGTITATFIWTGGSDTTTNSVVWQFEAAAFPDGTAIDSAYGTAQTVTDANASTANQVRISAATSAITMGGGTPAAGVYSQFRAARLGGNGSDTLATTAYLIGVRVNYTRNN